MKTKIAETKDGRPIYWGKKDTGDLTSRNLDFWVCADPLEFNTYVRVGKFAEENLFFREVGGFKTFNEEYDARRKKYESAIKAAISNLTFGDLSKLMERE